MFTQIKNFLVLLMVITIAFPSACKTKYPPLRIGNSIGIKDMNYERLKAMKDAGIDCIEITTGGFISTKKPKTDAEITELLKFGLYTCLSEKTSIFRKPTKKYGKTVSLYT